MVSTAHERSLVRLGRQEGVAAERAGLVPDLVLVLTMKTDQEPITEPPMVGPLSLGRRPM